MLSLRRTTVPAALVALAACAKPETPAQALPGSWTVVSDAPRELKGASFTFMPAAGPGQTFSFTPPEMMGSAEGEYAFSDTNRIEVRARGQLVGPKATWPWTAKPLSLNATFVVRVKSHDEVELMPLGGAGQAATLKRTSEENRPTATSTAR